MVERDGHGHWDSAYAAKAPENLPWYQELPRTSFELLARAAADPAAAIIDVGGGASRLVDLLLDAGRSNLTVLDLSVVSLARA